MIQNKSRLNQRFHNIYVNRGATLVGAEYFVNKDPGPGNGVPLSVDVNGNVMASDIKINRNDRIYLRYKDSYGRWGPARFLPYKFQNIVGAEYKLQYVNGTVSPIKSMTILSNTDPALAFFKALSDDIINSTADIDTLIIRFRTEEIIGHWQKFKWSDIPVTAIENSTNYPTKFKLYKNYPNPFNPTTIIKYDLAKNTTVTLEIYDFLGRKVRTLLNKKQSAGSYEVSWDGKNDQGIKVASGIYFYTLRAGKYVKTNRMILLK